MEAISADAILKTLSAINASTSAVSLIKNCCASVKEKITVNLESTYRNYLKNSFDKLAYTRTFFAKDQPSYIYDFYEPLNVVCGKHEPCTAQLSAFNGKFKVAVITGNAGCGKSTLLKHLFVEAINEGERIPIFVELRSLNKSGQTLISLVIETLHNSGLNLSEKAIAKIMSSGKTIVLLDGFDEIETDRRQDLSRQIQDLADTYTTSPILLSSRPDDAFTAWSRFMVFGIEPLTLDQATSLVEKSPINETVKARFAADLRKGLYGKHKSFLANPLLLTIMMLTYGENAEIPNKLSIFYNQAFEVLFQRHDAISKGDFSRSIRSGLDMQDFERVFSAFCLSSYDDEEMYFSTTSAYKHLDVAKKLTQIDFDSDSFIRDCKQAVCLLVDDGLFITFTHRSFQEYFCAIFLSRITYERRKELFDRFMPRIGLDSVFVLLNEMNSLLIAKYVAIPCVEEVREVMRNKTGISNLGYARLVRHVFPEIEVGDGIVKAAILSNVNNAQLWHKIDFLRSYLMPKDFYEDESPRKQICINIDDFSIEIGDTKRRRINLANLPLKHPIFNQLADSSWWFNKSAVTHLLNFGKVLLDDLQQSETSLDILLSK